MPIWTVCTRALSWSKGILTHSGLLTIYNLIIILSSKACSTDRADAAVRRSRSRLLHAAKWWVSRPDNARVASLRGDAGTQPLVHSCCPLWETSRSCPFIYAVLVMQNDSTMFILLNCLLDVARRMSLNGIAGSQIPGENAPRRQANQGW